MLTSAPTPSDPRHRCPRDLKPIFSHLPKCRVSARQKTKTSSIPRHRQFPPPVPDNYKERGGTDNRNFIVSNGAVSQAVRKAHSHSSHFHLQCNGLSLRFCIVCGEQQEKSVFYELKPNASYNYRNNSLDGMFIMCWIQTENWLHNGCIYLS